MKRELLCGLLALGAAGGISYGADRDRNRDRDRDRDRDRGENREDSGERRKGRAVVDEALEALYPARDGYEHMVKEPQDQNGVQVYDVDVKSPKGYTFARVTEYGDFMVSGAPRDAEAAPPAVREVVEGLFKDVNNVDAYVATYYFVYFRSGEQTYQVRLDAAGNIADIRTEKSLQTDMPAEPKKAAESEHARLAEIAQQRFGDVEIKQMVEYPDSPGFHVVNVQRGDDQGFVIVGPNNAIMSQRFDLDVSRLPEPIVRTVEQVFRADIRNAEKGEQQYWHFLQDVGDERLVLKLRPNGDVMEVKEYQPDSQEQQASDRRDAAGAGSGGDRAEDREDRRDDRRDRREERRDERRDRREDRRD